MKKLSGVWELPTEIPIINMPTEVVEAEFDLYISVLDVGTIKLNRVILIPPGSNYEFEFEGERLAIPVAAVIAEIEYQGETIPLPIYAQFDSNWEMDSRASVLTMHPQFAIIILIAVGQLQIDKEITVSDEFYNAFTSSIKKSQALSGTWTFNDEVDFSPILRGGISASEMGGEALEGTKLDTIMLSDGIFEIGAAPNGIGGIGTISSDDGLLPLYLSQAALDNPEPLGFLPAEVEGLQAGWQNEEAKVIALGNSPVYVSEAMVEFFRINATGGEIIEQEDGNVISGNEYQVNLTAYEANRALVSMSNLLKHSAEHKGKVVTATSNGFTLGEKISVRKLVATASEYDENEPEIRTLDNDLEEGGVYTVEVKTLMGTYLSSAFSIPEGFVSGGTHLWLPIYSLLAPTAFLGNAELSALTNWFSISLTLNSNWNSEQLCRVIGLNAITLEGTDIIAMLAPMIQSIKIYRI